METANRLVAPRLGDRQQGAALLGYMLALVLLTASLLLHQLNTRSSDQLARDQKTLAAMVAAKKALLGYAVTFPDHDTSPPVDGPGYLPCPDISNNGVAGGSCSFAGATTMGRYPYITLRAGDLVDSSGERLWLVISENFRYGSSKTIPLNSDAVADLTVDADDEVVAVILSPGPAIGNQSRITANQNNPAHYLEAENADGDTVFTSTGADPFNDLILPITHAEWRVAVERRVLAEAEQILQRYYTDRGRYPWPQAFAQSKVAPVSVGGEATGGSATTLTDTTLSPNFQSLSVTAGDLVHNLTDQSLGVVASVSGDTVTLASPGLTGGTDNIFILNDSYRVYRLGTRAATSGSGALTLEDTGTNFLTLNVAIGDMLDDITDGSSGRISAITSTTLTVESLTGGSNAFADLDTYVIRVSDGPIAGKSSGWIASPSPECTGTYRLTDTDTNFIRAGVQSGDLVVNLSSGVVGRIQEDLSGTATAGSAGFGLVDDTKGDFSSQGVAVGDVVQNVSDGSSGAVTATGVTLTVGGLTGGTNNAFAVGDRYRIPDNVQANQLDCIDFFTIEDIYAGAAFGTPDSYMIPRYNAHTSDYYTKGANQGNKGLLPISDDNDWAHATPTVGWAITGGLPTSTPSAADSARYVAELQGYAQTPPHDLTVNGACEWTEIERARCVGKYTETDYLSGTATANGGLSGTATTGSSGLSLIDSVKGDFATHAVAVGDTVTNLTTGASGTVTAVGTTLTVGSLTGGSSGDFTVGDSYAVSLATATTGGLSLADSARGDFSNYGVRVGDKVENLTDGSVGVLRSVGATLIAANLTGGTGAFSTGDSYRIHLATEDLYRTGVAKTAGFASSWWLLDYSGIDFTAEGVAVGDVVVNTDQDTAGIVDFVNSGALPASLRVSSLDSLADPPVSGPHQFGVGDRYRIHRNFIDQRTHLVDFALDDSASISFATSDGNKVRSLSFEAPGDAANFPVTTRPMVVVQDVDATATVVLGQTEIAISAGTATGWLDVTGIHTDMLASTAPGAGAEEISQWFVDNRWQDYVYYAVADDQLPDPTTTTIPLSLARGGNLLYNDVDLAVLTTGDEATNQDRVSGSTCALGQPAFICDYLEGDNADGDTDNVLERRTLSGEFNDQIRWLRSPP